METGAVEEVIDPTTDPSECWYIPLHIVSHNGNFHIIFNAPISTRDKVSISTCYLG